MAFGNDSKELPLSSVFFDWSPLNLDQLIQESVKRDSESEYPVVRVLLEYSPPRGQPPSPVVLRRSDKFVIINGTWPAVGYSLQLVSLFSNGSRKSIFNRIIYSSPPKPRLVSVDTSATTLNLTYAEPQNTYTTSASDLTYTFYLEYFRVCTRENIHGVSNSTLQNLDNRIYYVNTNVTTLRIRNLVPDNAYLLHVYSVFFGVRSMEPMEIIFKTKPLNVSTNATMISNYSCQSGLLKNQVRSSSMTSDRKVFHMDMNVERGRSLTAKTWDSELTEGISYSFVTAMAPAEVATVSPHSTSSIFTTKTFPAHTESTTRTSSLSKTSTINKPRNSIHYGHESTTVVTTSPYHALITEVSIRPTQLIQNTTMATNNVTINKNSEEGDSSTRELLAPTEPSEEDISIENESTEGPTDIESEKPGEQKSSTTVNVKEDESASKTAKVVNENSANAIKISLEPNSRSGGAKTKQLLRVEWNAPESILCDSFELTYAAFNYSDGNKTSLKIGHITEIRDSYSLIDFYDEIQLELNVSCIFEGAVFNGWSANRVIDLSRPQSISNLKVKELFTDMYYVSSVILDLDWPLHYDSQYYKVVVSWALGKKVVGKNHLDVTEPHQIINISGLEPAQLYTFTAVNVSTELQLVSTAVGLRQITPPVITSTLYPGQLSSTAININFGESDPEHPFDSYELIFSGKGIKNVTKRLQKNDPMSMNFNKLIPGKTYRFLLYTVYKRIKSRPVILDITTYPLKVSKFMPVLGPGYVTLFWEVENPSENHCRFRLDYSSTSNTGLRKSQTVNLNGTTQKHRFTGLDYDTFYTFTIIVIMGKDPAEAESESETSNIGFMSRPKSTPTLKRYGSRELAITFEDDHNIFADTNGVIESFAVIVAEDIELADDDFDLKSWYDVHEEEIWPAYRTSLSTYNPFRRRGSSRVTTYIIGEEDCERRKLHEPYCNGPLRAHTDYYVKIRAYSISNVAMETDWVSVRGVYVDKDEESETKSQRRLPCHMYLNGCNNGGMSLSVYSNYLCYFVILFHLLYRFIN
ncbi:tyrosine-protein phosphatase 10D [Ditylenchus destructor]|uniref:protein-tyrosine-phosphatase n=1 Tax=Ditylenchus destructor TaxID=166010 RepID=A0AAD4N2X7_9BILA|nr:tyrosine-protein phosphatase 10D [Ditylenchus destructor]